MNGYKILYYLLRGFVIIRKKGIFGLFKIFLNKNKLLANKIIDIARKGFRIIFYLPLFFKKRLPIYSQKVIDQMTIWRWWCSLVFRLYPQPRCYIKKELTRKQFFEKLNHRGIKYVLLRWWEDFPLFDESEDMDILVADEDVDLMKDLLVAWNTGMPCDIYTRSGVKGRSWQGLPYYSITLADALLKSRALYNDMVYVPSGFYYFASLTYHAVYHKGNNSGLPGFNYEGEYPDHPYKDILHKLAEKYGIKICITAPALSRWLERKKLGPSTDTLGKLITIRPELEPLANPLSCDIRGGEVQVFVLRTKAIEEGMLSCFFEILSKLGIEELESIFLEKRKKDICSNKMRGGRWDKGPYLYSGGFPALIIVAFDFHPSPPNTNLKANYARVTNKRTLTVKQKFRERLMEEKFIKGNYNGLHTADNEQEAFEYISIADNSLVNKIKLRSEFNRESYKTQMPVLKVLSKGRRSKVELVKINDNVAVKKTFRPSAKRFLERERFIFREISKELNFVPPLIDDGDYYIIMPFYENILKNKTHKEVIDILKKYKANIYKVIYEMWQRGLAYINFTPGNVIISPNGDFICIDFEFVYQYQNIPDRLKDAYEISGVPKNFKGDLPRDFDYRNSSFLQVWQPWIGSWKSLQRKFE